MDDIIEISVTIFGPNTYRETIYGLIFLRQGTNIGHCIGYSTDKNCLTGGVKPLTVELIKICDKYHITYQ